LLTSIGPYILMNMINNKIAIEAQISRREKSLSLLTPTENKYD